MEISFHGKRALVTGASQGIGRDIAVQLSKCGAKVIAVARNKELLAQLKSENPSIETISVNLTDWKATQAALSPVFPIDLLVNNAGIVILKPVPDFDEQDIDRIFNINVKALINVTQMVTKDLLSRKSPGSIVNISSQTAKVGLERHSIYCGTKGAVDAFTRGVALELGPHKIRINCVNPTVIMTEMGKLGYSDSKLAEPLKQKIPLRRFGEVREVTDAVLFLLSDKASMITGESLLVDGGYSITRPCGTKMEINFNGKTALVTGASQGIGRDIVKQLVQCGANVIAVARNSDLLESLKQEVPSIDVISCDLSDWNATQQALTNINPDLLVNNAGLAILKPLTEITESDIDQLFAINVKTLIQITKLVSEKLLKRKVPGSIVNISSQASMAGLLNHTVYCSTKGAVDAFTRAAALELGPHNIRVNCVNPTVIMTAMGKLGWSDPKVAEPMIQKIPLRRFGEVQEVVDAVLFLLSDKASMITGTCLPVDGGYLAV